MTRTWIALVAAGLAIPPAPAAAAGPATLDRLLAGKVAQPSRRCIVPDRSVQPEIIDGTAIVYRDSRYTYVAHFKTGCPALREGRRITTSGTGGQICENDPVGVSETTGTNFGFCTLDTFTPYRKP